MEEVLLSECEQVEAQLIEQCLRGANIPYRVEEPLNAVQTMISPSITPTYKIFCYYKDFDLAINLIKQMNKSSSTAYSWCPECGGEEIEKTTVHYKRGPKWMLYVMLVFIICFFVCIFIFDIFVFPGLIVILSAIFYFKPRTEVIYSCKKCGHNFTHY